MAKIPRNYRHSTDVDDHGIVIVTGAGGTGCGRAIAQRFAGRGAAVVVSDINEAGGHDTVRLIEVDLPNALARLLATNFRAPADLVKTSLERDAARKQRR